MKQQISTMLELGQVLQGARAIAGMTQVVFALAFDFLLGRGVLADLVAGRPFSWWTLVGIPLVLFPAAWLAVLRARFEEQKAEIAEVLKSSEQE